MKYSTETIPDLRERLMNARESLDAAIACAGQGDLFAAGSHYRAALIQLEEA